MDKKTKNLRICLLDLDLQTSHVCDYLDIEARLQLQEIVEQPERLDAQLFDLFVSSHSSGLAVMAAPRDKKNSAKFRRPGTRSSVWNDCDSIRFADYRSAAVWFPWTEQILSVSDLVVVTGFNNVPGLRQVAGTLQTVRQMERIPPQIAVALNRCRSRLLGRVANKQHAIQVLGQETIVYVREMIQQLPSKR